jgi:hypothetical protein
LESLETAGSIVIVHDFGDLLFSAAAKRTDPDSRSSPCL